MPSRGAFAGIGVSIWLADELAFEIDHDIAGRELPLGIDRAIDLGGDEQPQLLVIRVAERVGGELDRNLRRRQRIAQRRDDLALGRPGRARPRS